MIKLLEVKNLSVELGGSQIVEGVSFDLGENEILSIIGPNGSGKTTLVRALLGIIPYQGEIKWSNDNLNIGYLPQRLDVNQLIPITVEEFIKLNFVNNLSNKEKLKKIREVLGLFHGERLMNKNLANLSRGEFQRILLVSALVNDPQVLILDEPTAGVDPHGEEAVYEHVFKLKAQKGISIIFISHDISLVYKFSDRVICLNQKMTCFGTPASALTPEILKNLYGEDISVYEHDHFNKKYKKLDQILHHTHNHD